MWRQKSPNGRRGLGIGMFALGAGSPLWYLGWDQGEELNRTGAAVGRRRTRDGRVREGETKLGRCLTPLQQAFVHVHAHSDISPKN